MALSVAFELQLEPFQIGAMVSFTEAFLGFFT